MTEIEMMQKSCPFKDANRYCLGSLCMAFGRMERDDCYCMLIEAAVVKLHKPVPEPIAIPEGIPEGYIIREIKND